MTKTVRLAGLLAASLALAAPASAANLSAIDALDITLAYRLVTETFYQPIDGRTVVDGATHALSAYLHANGVTVPVLPDAHEPRNRADGADQISSAIAAAMRQSHADERTMTFVALEGAAKATGDRYTEFFTPEKLKAFNAPLDPAAISGVGVMLELDTASGYPRAFYVTPRSPAERAGIRAGDIFTSVGGMSTKGFTIVQTRALLIGAAGTNVSIVALRDGRPLSEPIVATRGQVHTPTVLYKLLPGNVGYISVLVFGAPTAGEFALALARLQAADASAYVLDLRNNGGGYVTAAVSIANHFIDRGPIVSEVDREKHETETDADGTAIARKPLAVLINGGSASASEITAGALHDAGYATLVGTRSFGKGVEQTMTQLPGGVAIKVTTMKYLTPTRREIDKIGIEPDTRVEASKNPRYADPASDAQLEAAVDLVAKKVAAAKVRARS